MSTLEEKKGLKITEMVGSVISTSTDLIPVIQDGINKKTTVARLKTSLGVPNLTSNLENDSTSTGASANTTNQLHNRLNTLRNELQDLMLEVNSEIDNINQTLQDGDVNVDWNNIKNKPTNEELKGPKGDNGPQGLRGIAGQDGLPGQRGPAGIDGANGTDGRDGVDGHNAYFHVKYSINANGNPMTDTPSKYIGTAVTNFITPPTNYTVYTWYEWKGAQGPDGEQGIPGTNGSDGKTSYLHIKYGVGYGSDDRMIFTANNGEDPGPWVGMYTDQILMDNSNPDTYTWSYVKGPIGEQGQDGTSFEYIFRLTSTLTRPATPPTSQVDDYVPPGWDDDPTDVTESVSYMWCSKRDKVNGIWSVFTEPALWAKWSKDGEPGIPGPNGPISVYLGTYNSTSTYIGNPKTLNIVKWNNGINDFYYITKITTGEITNVPPSNALYWETFQGQYKNIATEFLFAEGANIGGWIFHKNSSGEDELRSQNGSSILNGTTGSISLANSNSVFNSDGSGFLAGGRFSWNHLGELQIKSNIPYGISIQPPGSEEIAYPRINLHPGGLHQKQSFSGGYESSLTPTLFQIFNPSDDTVSASILISGSNLRFILKGLPTSSSGLSSGQIWNDGGILKINS